MFFDWVRNRVRNSVLAGFADAIDDLEKGGIDAHGDAAELLLSRLQRPVLAMAPTEPDATAKRRKADAK
jgi:hypothetical protein